MLCCLPVYGEVFFKGGSIERLQKLVFLIQQTGG